MTNFNTTTIDTTGRAKDYLNQLNIMRDDIAFMQNKLQNLRDLADDSSASLNPIKVLSSKEDNAKGIIIENMIDLENEIEILVKEYYNLVNDIEEKISTIPDLKCKMVLFYRYIKNFTFDEIIYELKISRTSIFRFHSKGIKILDNIC